MRATAHLFLSIAVSFNQNLIPVDIEARTASAVGRSFVYDLKDAIEHSALYTYVSTHSQKQGVSLFIVTILGGGAKLMHIDQNYNGREVTLAVGQDLELALSENRTTGFRWDLKNKAEPTCALVSSTFDPPKGHTGNGGVHRWQFRAVHAGSGEIELEYRRPWEKDATPTKVYKVGIRVYDTVDGGSTTPIE